MANITKRVFDNKQKKPPVMPVGGFTQISNHLIFNPTLTPEEKEFIMVFLSHRDGYYMTIQGFCNDLHINARQVLIRINSLVEKGILAFEGNRCKLIIPTINHPRVRTNTSALDDNKNCDTTQKLPEENAVDSKNNCSETQVKTELLLEQQGIPEVEKTINKTGSDERTERGARTSENIKKDSVNASTETISSGGRTPVEGAPPANFSEFSTDFSDDLESIFSEPDRRVRSEAPTTSEFWKDEEIMVKNYRWYKYEWDRDENFRYTFPQFEEILALALVYCLVRNEVPFPKNNSELQQYGRFIGNHNLSGTQINAGEYAIGKADYETTDPDRASLNAAIFYGWKIKKNDPQSVRLPDQNGIASVGHR